MIKLCQSWLDKVSRETDDLYGDDMLPTDAQERKNTPVYTGFICFFPLAIAEVARHSHESTQQHHPGEPCHWDKNKSTDEKDSQARHLLDQAFPDQTLDEEIGHARAGAWRAMANLERLCSQRIENSNIKNLVEPKQVTGKWVAQGEYWRAAEKETVEQFRERTGGDGSVVKSTRQAPRSNV